MTVRCPGTAAGESSATGQPSSEEQQGSAGSPVARRRATSCRRHGSRVFGPSLAPHRASRCCGIIEGAGCDPTCTPGSRRRLHGAAGDGLHGAGRRAAGGRVVDRVGGADRVRRARLVAGAVGRSRVDDRPDGRHGDRTACRSRPRPGGGVGRRAQPDRGRVVPGRPIGPPRRDRRSALPAAARRLSRRCGRADGRRAAGQDDRHDRRGRQPRRSAQVVRRSRRRHRTC